MNIENLYNDITNLDIDNSRKDLNRALNYISSMHKQYPDFDSEQLMYFIDINFINNAKEYYNIIDRLSGTKVQLLVRDYAEKNESELKKTYQKYVNKKLKEENSIYTYDMQKSMNIFVKDMLYNLRKLYPKYHLNPTPQEEYNFLKTTLLNCKEGLQKSQKNDNIKILQLACTYFSEHGTFSLLKNSQNKQLKILGLDSLGYSLKPDEKDFPDDIGIEKFFSKEYLKNLSIDELSALNIFWQNKYSKEMKSIGFGYFVFQQLDLFKTLPKSNINFSNETLKNLLVKYKFLEYLSKNLYEKKAKNEKFLSSKLQSDYNLTFSKLLPHLDNSLEEDLEQCFDRFIAIQNTYAIKNNLTCGMIMDFVDNKKLKNWGYINENEDGKPNTIQDDSKNIIIGIDYPGLNRPICVHVDKDMMVNALINMKQTIMLPVYEGNNDFVIPEPYRRQVSKNSYLQNHITLPLEKRHKIFLRQKKLIEENPRHDLIEHLQFLANPDKFPKHLKDKNQKRVRKYVNMGNGVISTEEELKKLNKANSFDKER